MNLGNNKCLKYDKKMYPTSVLQLITVGSILIDVSFLWRAINTLISNFPANKRRQIFTKIGSLLCNAESLRISRKANILKFSQIKKEKSRKKSRELEYLLGRRHSESQNRGKKKGGRSSVRVDGRF